MNEISFFNFKSRIVIMSSRGSKHSLELENNGLNKKEREFIFPLSCLCAFLFFVEFK